jgi:hypothetical protein
MLQTVKGGVFSISEMLLTEQPVLYDPSITERL